MLPLELIRRDPERVRRAAQLKGEDAPIDQILELDRRWREHLHAAETIKADQNRLSKEFAQTRDESLKVRLKEMAERARADLAQAEAVKRELDDLLLASPRTHYDLGESLGIMDFEHAARVSASRFAFLPGEGARLERALVQFMLDVHTREHGYLEVQPPVLVNSASMVGTANLPKFGADAFKIEDRDLWLVPTAEVPLTNYHRDEILDAESLPRKYVAYTPCFRSEAGAAGKDTRGFIRLHQFSKVELVKITGADTSMSEFEGLLADAEEILQRLGLHYQVMLMCSGDMGFAQYKKFDLNAWCPGLGRYLEVSSCSVFNDFQAMRANIRYRPSRGAPPRFAHTINGSGLALTRTIDAILETYQRPDGTIEVPEQLRPYLGGADVIGKR